MKLQITSDNKIVNYGQEPWSNQNDYPDAKIIDVDGWFDVPYDKDNYWINGKLLSNDIDNSLLSVNDKITAIQQQVNDLTNALVNNSVISQDDVQSIQTTKVQSIK